MEFPQLTHDAMMRNLSDCRGFSGLANGNQLARKGAIRTSNRSLRLLDTEFLDATPMDVVKVNLQSSSKTNCTVLGVFLGLRCTTSMTMKRSNDDTAVVIRYTSKNCGRVFPTKVWDTT